MKTLHLTSTFQWLTPAVDLLDFAPDRSAVARHEAAKRVQRKYMK